MAELEKTNTTVEEEYDEDADSDFDVANASDQLICSSSEDDKEHYLSGKPRRTRPQVRAKSRGSSQQQLLELESGDEATIRERDRPARKQKQNGEDDQDDVTGIEEEGWRVRTRAMRRQTQLDKKRSELASVERSTLDVDKMWEAMNRPGGLDDLLRPAVTTIPQVGIGPLEEREENSGPSQEGWARFGKGEVSRGQELQQALDDMVTIDEVYEFAGEVHTRKKTVPRSSAEAKLWLSQAPTRNLDPRFPGGEPVRRPLRKISRFDPNLNNLDSFKKNWERHLTDGAGSRVQKLNTVEKSKLDWAAHVDQEGLQDELTEHAKAKGGYLSRMEFLGQVEQRKEEEARRVRVKG